MIAVTAKERPAAVRRLLNGAGLFALVMGAVFAVPAPSCAANVSGTLIGSDGGPQADRQVHFEDRVTHDIFLAQTGPDGNFSVDLPPGIYQLRSEHGAAILSRIEVQNADVAIGRVKESWGFSPARLFGRQGVARGIVNTQAPSTANIPAWEDTVGGSSTPAANQAPEASASPSGSSRK